ncbi:methylaspartate mutase [Propionigenium maris DSM 9537]|uniref:Methylaspartate mutase n=1 Tax=Propionigenium maris DSM 9537 TaxID=1123000 RepID=A0A9W6GMW4_9FUSO|nr:methylaspartate mutase accessory protein GlmL [Propionigenium maris]GLI57040.1 methylaspartate mutase [Propionigenium maris DSM 9537]
MKVYLTIDFGSTYTKLTAIDLENEEILATSKAITTIEDDIMTGFNNAFVGLEEEISSKTDLEKVEFVRKVACSSAAGGLKMVAIGLVPDLTADAAKKAALGAGARVMKTYSFELNHREMQEIKDSPLDIILLAGGTDGGNKNCIIHNAKLIAEFKLDVPVVVAGNKAAIDEIEEIFKEANIDYYIADNVMPKLNKLDVEPSREAIRKVFMNKIVEAKGLGNAEEFVSGILMPTPAAVLKAAEVLADGSDDEEGLGDLIVVDIGGATTDIHSIANGHPTQAGVMPKGLEDPYAKRTVEGDLGMRYSALALLEAAGTKKIREYLGDADKEVDVKDHCNYRHDHIKMVPQTEDEIKFDEAMAMAATEIAMARHCGTLESVFTPLGAMYYQIGKDLINTPYVIGTGGVIIHSENPHRILASGNFNANEPVHLRPRNPRFLVDRTYILSAMGLLAQELPDVAVRIMKKYLIEE